MKNKALNLRRSERRLNKLRLYSAQKDKTMTQVIEDFIDSLKLENGDSALRAAPLTSTPRPVKPTV
ncbi:hypothetical protein MiSe_84720 [Microseira wollei NIES-4236]|uniref:CopG domain protein DNA-binding domain protein n=1 Tax=Microseira wollei NIES-4236 TaxID=2530354 RepID=A0AAV3XTV9_9CYAN|nr:hypothetical protein MiSe_84720 [Microseira wollei NIES-4236]